MLVARRVLLAVAALITLQAAVLAQPEGRVIELNGFEMFVQEAGSGEPLVLLHGFAHCGAVHWGAFVDDLALHYRVIVPDLRGHGRSTNPSGEFTHRQSASDLLALADALGIDRFRAMGISSGGMTLLHVAVREPERLESLVLIGTAPEIGDQARTVMRLSAQGVPPEVDQLRRACLSRGEEQLAELSAQFLGFADTYDDMNLTAAELGTITARTLIVHGDRDMFFPVEVPVGLYRAIPGSALWVVPGGLHVPIFGPVAPEFLRVALGHLAAH